MKKNIFFTVLSALAILVISSCAKEEFKPYDHPFFHIHVDEQDSVNVLYNRKDVVEYKVYLSSKLQFDPIDVEYEIIPGNGLEEGRDYQLLTQGTTLHFVQGMFERSIKIAWLERRLDPAMNNTLTIRLKSNTKNFTIGLPGPDKKQSQLVITKIN